MRRAAFLVLLLPLFVSCGDDEEYVPTPHPANRYQLLIGASQWPGVGVDWTGMLNGEVISGTGVQAYYLPLDEPLPICASLALTGATSTTLELSKWVDDERVETCSADFLPDEDGHRRLCYPDECWDPSL